MVKKLLKPTIGGRVLDTDVFETLIAGVAGIMNRRPLTAASADVNDPLVLSPAHFLYPYIFTNTSTSIIPPSPDLGDTLRASWKSTQTVLDDFWRRWNQEYLTTLAKKSKWIASSDKGPKMNQLCLLTDANVPRDMWRMVRVETIVSADTTHPRRFIVKDSHGTRFDRHCQQLVPLELDGE